MGCSVNYKVVSAKGFVNTTDLVNHELSPPVLTERKRSVLHYDVFFFLSKKGTCREKGLYPRNPVVRVNEELVILKLKAKDRAVTLSLSLLKTLIRGSPWICFCINFDF